MNPGLGELLDRLSILELKLAHGGGVQFEEERRTILERFSDTQDGGLEVLKAYAQLAAINAAIWQSEDALRDLRPAMVTCDAPDEVDREQHRGAVAKSAFLAHKLQTLNDRRAELVREIGKLAGEVEHREKLSGGQAAKRPWDERGWDPDQEKRG